MFAYFLFPAAVALVIGLPALPENIPATAQVVLETQQEAVPVYDSMAVTLLILENEGEGESQN